MDSAATGAAFARKKISKSLCCRSLQWQRPGPRVALLWCLPRIAAPPAADMTDPAQDNIFTHPLRGVTPDEKRVFIEKRRGGIAMPQPVQHVVQPFAAQPQSPMQHSPNYASGAPHNLRTEQTVDVSDTSAAHAYVADPLRGWWLSNSAAGGARCRHASFSTGSATGCAQSLGSPMMPHSSPHVPATDWPRPELACSPGLCGEPRAMPAFYSQAANAHCYPPLGAGNPVSCGAADV